MSQPFGKDVRVVYVTGIGGKGPEVRRLTTGLQAAGYKGEFAVHDWTGGQSPLAALWNGDRQRAESRRLARDIERQRLQDPRRRIVLMAHSGGAGVAVRALEALPAGAEVDSVLLLAPALSPRYDLTRALRRVSGRATVFTSHRDGLVLGLGTFLFGTVEGAHGEAAGLFGFRRPPKADRQSYAKLAHRPYRREWLAYGNRGGHFGALSTSFAAYVLAPVLHGSDDLAKAPDPGMNEGAKLRRGTREAADETSNHPREVTHAARCGGSKAPRRRDHSLPPP